ncbi:FAD binding domain-containing protein [Algihabitans albus]|uniref:FAD binding domain-containing protein n=1 Tax=Algihabitans albus TaxID=2164067 RepID=UPI000E5D3217|nr:xanthine dehydrogenase family protein subunit M [Algihabitans albus]
MIPGSFEYHRPASVGETVDLLARLGEESRVIAGGHSLIPMMKLRLAVPEHLIDLQSVEGLKDIAVEGDDITIGAMVTQHRLIESEALAAACPILRETSTQIADPQIRYCGTLGGNVANGDPGNDMPALMQALDASYLLAGPEGTREVKARDFYEAAYFTALNEGEILTAVRFTAPSAGHGWAYEKQKRKIGDYATAAAAVLLTLSGGTCSSASVALTNVADTPLLAEEAGAILTGSRLDADTVDRAAKAAAAITDPAEDGRGPVEFRRHLTAVMVRRAVATAQTRAA